MDDEEQSHGRVDSTEIPDTASARREVPLPRSLYPRIQQTMCFDSKNPPRPGGRVFFPVLLLASVYSFGVFQLLWRGLYRQALYACAFAVLGLLATQRKPPRLEKPFLVLLALGAVLFAQGYILAGDSLNGNFHSVLLWSLLLVFAITLLPTAIGNQRIDHRVICAALLLISIPIQIVAELLINHKTGKAGLFSNIHMLALYSVLTLPILFYFALDTRKGLRWLFILALIGDFWLLLRTQSRPGFLALLAGSLAVAPILSPRRRLLAFGASLLVPVCLYSSGLLGFDDRIDELIRNFAKEERLAIWRETLLLQQTSAPLEWVFGHGFGQFYLDYQPYSSFHYKKEDYPSPHNFILELLYSHGAVGLILVSAAYIAIYRALLQALSNAQEPARKKLAVLFICIVTTHFVHTFLTLPIFSRPALYPFGLILGAIFRFLHDPASAAIPESRFHQRPEDTYSLS